MPPSVAMMITLGKRPVGGPAGRSSSSVSARPRPKSGRRTRQRRTLDGSPPGRIANVGFPAGSPEVAVLLKRLNLTLDNFGPLHDCHPYTLEEFWTTTPNDAVRNLPYIMSKIIRKELSRWLKETRDRRFAQRFGSSPTSRRTRANDREASRITLRSGSGYARCGLSGTSTSK
ncbi:hypothetical protein V8E36_007378 [Tilletia maclaganii]